MINNYEGVCSPGFTRRVKYIQHLKHSYQLKYVFVLQISFKSLKLQKNLSFTNIFQPNVSFYNFKIFENQHQSIVYLDIKRFTLFLFFKGGETNVIVLNFSI